MTEEQKNVFEAIEDDPAAAQNLFLRGQLMIELKKRIEDRGLAQKEAAETIGVSQPRISDLMRGKIDRFTIDMLVNMLGKFGLKVELKLEEAA